ncbi:hypothetical protein A8F94_10185 [Bacillus sp. FJAT-27225]|uniref:hypothetical protein n=1 Tax=Bacillus sp. FJAT-27225 TaxID=1743144 RepID=UPI00080C2C38|nr:hypothetical protein [Bacillus sp. FJAT-27225]OCA88169.1 hypothetical protein A8F94_10185 [Bacillus sp. FJAT-27225]
MSSSAQQELYLIKRELQTIINELEQIAGEIGHEFEGIGSEQCASAIHRVADQYRNVKRKLGSVDVTNVKE